MNTVEELTHEATLEFTLGNSQDALKLLDQALQQDPKSYDALLAKSEILLADRDLDNSLNAAQAAHKLNPDDILINTTLSRIWVALGNKEKAEAFGAQARMLGWKDTLANPEN